MKFPSKLVFVSFLFVLIFGATGVRAYDATVSTCGYVSGVSSHYSVQPDSGRVDFNRGDWSEAPPNYAVYPPVGGTVIAPADRLCLSSSGEVSGSNQWVWNSNVGWLDFGWCTAALPGCESYKPSVDLALAGPLASTGDAYWSGFAWNDNVGWIQFDWTCPSCNNADYQLRVHTELPTPWPSAVTTNTGEVTGFAWSDRLGWIRFGNYAPGGVVQDLPSGTPAVPTVYVLPEISVTPNPLNVTKYGLGLRDFAPLANAEDPYDFQIDFQILDAQGNPTGTYLSPSDYTVQMTPITTVGSNFSTLKDPALASGPNAVFWDSFQGQALEGGFVWSVKSFAPTSNLNGYENASGLIYKYFDMDANDVPTASRDHYTISDFDFTFAPVSGGPAAATASTWVLAAPIDLKFAPLIEVTNMAYSPSDSDTQPFLNVLPSTVDQDFFVRGLAMNWNTSPTVNIRSWLNLTSPIQPSGGFYDGAYRLVYGTRSQTTPAANDFVLKFPYSLGGPLLTYPDTATPPFTDFSQTDPIYVATLAAKLASSPASQFVPLSIASAQRLKAFSGSTSTSLTIPNPEKVRLFSDILGSRVLDYAFIRSDISYSIQDPRDPTQDYAVYYHSNYLATSPLVGPQAPPIMSYPDFNPIQFPNFTWNPWNQWTQPIQWNQWNILNPPNPLNLGGPTVNLNEYATSPLRQSVVISGNLTGNAIGSTWSQSSGAVVVGNANAVQVRNRVYQRFARMKKGVVAPAGNYGSNSINFISSPNWPTSTPIPIGTSLDGGNVLYFSGNTQLQSLPSNYSQKTIVVEGGDLYINATNIDGDSALGIVVLRNAQGVGGDVYIDDGVRDLKKVNIYADGSVRSATYLTINVPQTPWVNATVNVRQTALTNQLYISGSLVSRNTIGGVDSLLLPSGLPASNALAAAEYDLNHLREFQVCWKQVTADPLNPSLPVYPIVPIDTDVDGITVYATGIPDEGDVQSCSSSNNDYLRSVSLTSMQSEPLHIDYLPPPSSLPLLGEDTWGGLKFIF